MIPTHLSLANMALMTGGGVGAVVSVIHGVAMDRYIVRPIDRALDAGGRINPGSRRLIAPLLQYSTFAWLTGGLAVMAAAALLGAEAQRIVGLLVGATYGYAAVGNLWATRCKHPGGWLMALAVGLIGFGLV